MKTPRLANAMSYIDDELVSCAVGYKSNSRKKITCFLRCFAAASCIVLVLGICLKFYNQRVLPREETAPVGEAPAHFYFEGNLYSFSGETVYSIPEGYNFVGEVINVGDNFTGTDFEGNVDGYIYMSETDKTIAYFQWQEWMEVIDGKEPFLVLNLIM